MEKIDVAIIGGGVVGLAVAAAVAFGDRDVFIFEKNMSFGQETSSRNSEVIHSGIYYPVDSLKKKTCIEGNRMLYDLCRENGIAYRRTGKIIVAKDNTELGALEVLYNNGIKNGLKDIRMISSEEVKRIEPNVTAVQAVFLPMTGIIDSHALMEYFLYTARSKGADIVYDSEITDISVQSGGYVLRINGDRDDAEELTAEVVINCAGLGSDDIARMAGITREDYTLHYCKGDYFRVRSDKSKMIKGLVYPVVKPDDNSLGIHATPDLTGGIRLGPDAEYTGSRDLDYNINPSKRRVFYENVKGFLPFIEEEDLSVDTAGIRPKLQAPGDGVKDFVIKHEKDEGLEGFIDLVGIESPGLTASPAIALMVKEIVSGLL